MNVMRKAIYLTVPALTAFLLFDSAALPTFVETEKAEIHAGDVVCFGTCDDAWALADMVGIFCYIRWKTWH